MDSLRTSKQISKGFNCDALHPRDLGEYSVKGACFEGVVLRNGNEMDGRSWAPQPNVTSLLAKDLIAQTTEQADKAVGGDAARQFHAASTGINSSLT